MMETGKERSREDGYATKPDGGRGLWTPAYDPMIGDAAMQVDRWIPIAIASLQNAALCRHQLVSHGHDDDA